MRLAELNTLFIASQICRLQCNISFSLYHTVEMNATWSIWNLSNGSCRMFISDVFLCVCVHVIPLVKAINLSTNKSMYTTDKFWAFGIRQNISDKIPFRWIFFTVQLFTHTYMPVCQAKMFRIPRLRNKYFFSTVFYFFIYSIFGKIESFY